MSKNNLSKEDMALEALIKLVAELEGSPSDYLDYVSKGTIDYVDEAIRANGWEIYVNHFGGYRARKIVDAQKA